MLLRQARIIFSKQFSTVVKPRTRSTIEFLSCIQTTDLVETDVDSINITVTPKIMYQFQAVARRDMGVIGGIDWSKSPAVGFKTSSSNREEGSYHL